MTFALAAVAFAPGLALGSWGMGRVARRLEGRVTALVRLYAAAELAIVRYQARRRFAECAELRASDDPYDVAMRHLNDAALAYAAGERRRALELLGTAQSTLDDAGIALDPDDAFEVDWLRSRVGGIR